MYIIEEIKKYLNQLGIKLGINLPKEEKEDSIPAKESEETIPPVLEGDTTPAAPLPNGENEGPIVSEDDLVYPVNDSVEAPSELSLEDTAVASLFNNQMPSGYLPEDM